MENVFASLCSLLRHPSIRAAFLAGEGVELMILLMKAKKGSRPGAIKSLAFALEGREAPVVKIAETFVEAGGLGTVFGGLMGKVIPRVPHTSSLLIFDIPGRRKEKDLQHYHF